MSGRVKVEASVVTPDTPTYPDARRGDSVEGAARTTPEQNKAGLVWWACAFCGRNVLVDAWRRTREKCECGARRCHHTTRDGWYSEGWRRDGEEWWTI